MDALLPLTEAHRAAFARLSADRSPLHVDAEHARRTPFGKVVLHGMAGVFAALGAWSKGQKLELTSIRGRFNKPLFTDEPPLTLSASAPFTLSEAEGRVEGPVTLKLMRGRSTRLELKFSWRPFSGVDAPAAPFTPLKEAADPAGEGPFRFARLPYDIEGDAAAFGLWLPRHQLCALAGASYLVGMVVPGRQALFSEFALELEPSASAPFSFRELEATFDPRFGQFQITGTGSGLKSMSLGAFRRPEPVQQATAGAAAVFGWKAQPFAGQTALVTGASRGFGAAIAQGLALGGAKVLLHHRTGRAEASALRDELAAAGAEATLVQADLSSEADCARLAEAFRDRPLDLVVHGAAPPISAEGFFDQDASEVLEAISRALALDVRATHALLPAVKPGGRWLYISTSFTKEPEPKFAHYVAAKAGTEGLLRALAAELKGPQLLVARPPRMLTDQTNLPFHRVAPRPAVEVAKALLEALAAAPREPRYLELAVHPELVEG